MSGLDVGSVGEIRTTGGFLSDVSSQGSIGNIQVAGGDLSTVTAATESIGSISVVGGAIVGAVGAPTGSIGNITVKGVAFFEKGLDGTGNGGIVGGSIEALITAGGSIGRITVLGSGISSAAQVRAGDSIRAVSLTGLLYTESIDWLASGTGGRTKRTSKCYAWVSLEGLITAGNKLGTITVVGGDVRGTFLAGSIAGISAKAVAADGGGVPILSGGNIVAAIEVRSCLGPILAQGVAVSAVGRWAQDPDSGYRWFDMPWAGDTMGGSITLALHLGVWEATGGVFVNPQVKVGTIRSSGGDLKVTGVVATDLVLASFVSKAKCSRLTYRTYDTAGRSILNSVWGAVNVSTLSVFTPV